MPKWPERDDRGKVKSPALQNRGQGPRFVSPHCARATRPLIRRCTFFLESGTSRLSPVPPAEGIVLEGKSPRNLHPRPPTTYEQGGNRYRGLWLRVDLLGPR